ncbi:MAG: hypothetical protein EPN26_04480 [Rhodospirillales bacterium]|nr:MAG: hypothetical protein EPN26_04480 [Rhodospirillales bacterium]
MEWQLFAQLAVTFLVAVLGWLVAHYFASQRDLANERRKLRTQYLIEAYRKLESASNRSDDSFESCFEKFESAIADIQLLGTPMQGKLARAFALEFAKNGTASLDALAMNLRSTLRKELQLEDISDSIVYLRLNKEKFHKRHART